MLKHFIYTFYWAQIFTVAAKLKAFAPSSDRVSGSTSCESVNKVDLMFTFQNEPPSSSGV